MYMSVNRAAINFYCAWLKLATKYFSAITRWQLSCINKYASLASQVDLTDIKSGSTQVYIYYYHCHALERGLTGTLASLSIFKSLCEICSQTWQKVRCAVELYMTIHLAMHAPKSRITSGSENYLSVYRQQLSVNVPKKFLKSLSHIYTCS
jgi:hypothetical protein